MPRHPLPIQSYRKTTSESVVNCFAETKPVDQLGAVALVRAPGIRTLADLGGVGRGLSILSGQLYALVDSTITRVSTFSTGVTTAAGSIPGVGRVSMAATVDRLCIVADGNAWLMDPAGAVTQITDPDFRIPASVDFIDQFLMFTERDSAVFFSSDLNAPESYDSTMFATAEFQPDQLLGLIADHGQIFLAGERTVELWGNVGGAGFPYSKLANGAIELGCAAGRSLAKLDNSVFWLASDMTVRRLSGYTPVRVSTHGIEEIIRGWGDVSDAWGMSYTFGGHLMYVLSTKKGTVVFDASTGEWHERRSYGYEYWRIVSIVQYAELVYFLSEDGKVGIMDSSVYQEFGEIQRVEFTCKPIYAEQRRVCLDSIDLVVKTQ